MEPLDIDPLPVRKLPDPSSPRFAFELGRLLRHIEKHGPHSAVETDPTETSVKGILTTEVGDPQPVATRGDKVYLGEGSNFYVVDVADPDNPTVVGTLTTSNLQNLHDMVVSVDGQHVFCASDRSPHFNAVDVSDPTAPTLASSLSLAGTFDESRMITGPINDHVFLTLIQPEELVAVDISTPTSPSVSDRLTSADFGSSAEPEGVTSRAAVEHVYLITQDGSGSVERFRVIDVSTPASMSILGTVAASDNHQALVANPDGTYVYGYRGGFEVFDVSTPSSPTSHSTLTTGLNHHPGEQDGAFLEDRVFFLYRDGSSDAAFVAFDVSDPADPVIDEQHIFHEGAGVETFPDMVISDDNAFLYATSQDQFTIVRLGSTLGAPPEPQTTAETTYDVAVADGVDTVAARRDHTHGTQPSVPDPYTPSNVTTDRTFDADSTTLAELADILGTLINDLIEQGILNAP